MMFASKERIPLLWDEESVKSVEDGRGNVSNNMHRWQPGTGHNPQHAAGDNPSPDQFTDIVPALPVYKAKEKAYTFGAILYLILLAIYIACIIVSAILVPTPHNYLVLAITCSCHAGVFAVTGLLQRHLVAEQLKEKRQGYIKFSKQLDWIIYLPHSVFSVGTTGVLLVVVWQPKEAEDGVPYLFLIRGLILSQIFLAAIFVGFYLRRVHLHHTVARHPDVMNSLYSALNPPVSLVSVRYNDGGLAEQQAMLLHYQHENLRYLSEEILRLQETLSKYDRSQDGNTPQVDVVHLLEAREQELRAVTAERDQLLAELRMARSLIGDRDAEIKQVQAVIQQHVEENQRVRAMLEEWSSQTAKLEIALEAERLANVDLQKRVSMSRHHSGDSKLHV